MGWGTVAVAALWTAFLLRQVLIPFVVALALSYVLEPPVRSLHRRGLHRISAILVVYALVGLLIGLVVVFLIPQFLQELGELSREIPKYTKRLSALASTWQKKYSSFPLPDSVRHAVDNGIKGLEGESLKAITSTVESIWGLAGSAWTLILVPFLSFYMLKDAEYFRRLFTKVIPPETRSYWLSLLQDCDRVLSGFIRGQVIIAFIVGASLAVVAAVLRLPFPLLLGMIAGFGEFVPYFGPIIGSVPAMVFAANQSSQTFLQMLMAIIIIHQVEQAVLFPLIMGDSIGLHPLLVIFALLLGGHFFGLPGLIVAVPLAGILRCFWIFVIRFPAGGYLRQTEDDPEVSP